MGSEILQLVAVNAGLIALLVLPWLAICRLLMPTDSWPRLWMSALVMGTALQSVTGMLWSHLVHRWPYGELALYVLLWLIIGLLSWRWRPAQPQTDNPVPRAQDRHGALLMILAAAFVVRSIHPLQVAYLGQSDAYTHLHYLHNILDYGRLINPIYPPGYHWLLALPGMVFCLDPYVTARFGGAFFGVGLVLSLYVMLDHLFNRRTAIFGSFCAACFPLMMLLLKTGVGAFSNQFGIMLLPIIMLTYASTVITPHMHRPAQILFSLSMVGLIATVPMMTIHLLIIIAIERVIALLRRTPRWGRDTTKTVLYVLPALLLLGFHVTQAGQKSRGETTTMLVGDHQAAEPTSSTGQQETVAPPPTTPGPLTRLAADFFSIKRGTGFSHVGFNVAAAVVAAVFLGALVVGLRRQAHALVLLGIWGLVTSIQTFTGFLQFSAYQREGWSLLVATCGMAGILAAYIYTRGESLSIFRVLVAGAMVAGFIGACSFPPRHPALKSPAEDMIVRTVRFFGRRADKLPAVTPRESGPLLKIAGALDSQLPLEIVTRRFSAWGAQDEIAPNVLQRQSPAKVLITQANYSLPRFKRRCQYVVLIDRLRVVGTQTPQGVFARLTPEMVAQTVTEQTRLHAANAGIEAVLQALPEADWEITHAELTATLSAYAVVPRKHP